jgi:hypothetical protein
LTGWFGPRSKPAEVRLQELGLEQLESTGWKPVATKAAGWKPARRADRRGMSAAGLLLPAFTPATLIATRFIWWSSVLDPISERGARLWPTRCSPCLPLIGFGMLTPRAETIPWAEFHRIIGALHV